MLKNIFKTRLIALRLKSHKTQTEVANILGITLRSYQYYESYKKSFLPSYNALIKLSNLFNVSVDYLLGCTENPVRNL
jgi:transcriptional regulator with XRE-family HTH domain